MSILWFFHPLSTHKLCRYVQQHCTNTSSCSVPFVLYWFTTWGPQILSELLLFIKTTYSVMEKCSVYICLFDYYVLHSPSHTKEILIVFVPMSYCLIHIFNPVADLSAALCSLLLSLQTTQRTVWLWIFFLSWLWHLYFRPCQQIFTTFYDESLMLGSAGVQ